MSFIESKPSKKVAGVRLPPIKMEQEPFIVRTILSQFPYMKSAVPQSTSLIKDDEDTTFSVMYFSMDDKVFAIPYVIKKDELQDIVMFIFNDKSYPLTQSNFREVLGDELSQTGLAPVNDTNLSVAPSEGRYEESIQNYSPDSTYPKTASLVGYPINLLHDREKLKQALSPLDGELLQLIDDVNLPLLDVAINDLIVYHINDKKNKMYIYRGDKDYLDVNIKEIDLRSVPSYMRSLGHSDETVKKLMNTKLLVVNPPAREDGDSVIRENGFYDVECSDGTRRKGARIDGIFVFEDGNYCFSKSAYGKAIESASLPYKKITSLETGDNFLLVLSQANNDHVSVAPFTVGYKSLKNSDPDTVTFSIDRLAEDLQFNYPDIEGTLCTSKRISVPHTIFDGNHRSLTSPDTQVIILKEEVGVQSGPDFHSKIKTSRRAKYVMGEIHVEGEEAITLFGSDALDHGKFAFYMKALTDEDPTKAYDRIRHTGQAMVDINKIHNPFLKRAKLAEAFTPINIPAVDLFILSKYAEEMETELPKEDIVKIVGLNAINSENVDRFISYIPELDKILHMLSQIILNAQLEGPEDIARSAEVIFMKVREFIDQLRDIHSLYG